MGVAINNAYFQFIEESNVLGVYCSCARSQNDGNGESMFTRDIEIERLKAEYASLRQAQDGLMQKVDLTAAVLIRLEESVSTNSEGIQSNRQDIQSIKLALQAIMEHFEIAPKPGTGFNPEQQP